LQADHAARPRGDARVGRAGEHSPFALHAGASLMRSARYFRVLLPIAALAVAGCRTGAGGGPTPIVGADAAARAALASEATLGSLPAGTRTVGVVPLTSGDSALEPLGYALADLLL